MKRQPIKTPNEIFDENITKLFENVNTVINDLVEKQQFLLEINSVSFNVIQALKKVLQKNGIISVKELDAEIKKIQNENKKSINELKYKDFLQKIDEKNMMSC